MLEVIAKHLYRRGMPESEVVIVGGCGHVGLPFGLVLAGNGISTIALDIDSEKIENVSHGNMPFMEEGAEALLKQVLSRGTFRVTTEATCIRTAKYVIFVIGTPVDEHLSPNPNSVINAIFELKDFLVDGQTIILRSTLFPGVAKKVLYEISKVFPSTKVVYCPERIVEGQAIEELRTLPQIVGSESEEASDSAKSLFDRIGVECVFGSFEEAELSKLFTNVWRYVKFATANQFWMMSNDLGVDYERVKKLMSYGYQRAADLPSAGLTAGPCLFKDTMQLSALVQQNFPLGNAAMMINEGTPGYIVNRLKKQYNLRETKVGILGVAFKANVDDIRSSLAFKLKKLLEFESAGVLLTDPYVVDHRLVGLERVMSECDVLILCAPHTVYQSLSTNKRVIDIWGFFGQGVIV